MGLDFGARVLEGIAAASQVVRFCCWTKVDIVKDHCEDVENSKICQNTIKHLIYH